MQMQDPRERERELEHLRSSEPPPLSEQIRLLREQLEAFQADYEVHLHEISEISHMAEVVREVDQLRKSVERIERLMDLRL